MIKPVKYLTLCSRKHFTKKLIHLSTYVAFSLCVMICTPVVFARADTGVTKADTDIAQSQLAKKIVSIRSETNGQGFKVHIIADGKLKDYNSFRTMRPQRLVIDLPGIQSHYSQRTVFFGNLLVKSIQLDNSYKDKVRIVFDLLPKTELPYMVFSIGNQLIVAFGSVPGSPIARHTENIQKVSPVSSPEKKEVVLERDYEKPALTNTCKVTGIELETGKQGVKAYILVDGKLTRYDGFHLSDPPRLVVDLFGVQSAVGKTMLFSNPLVKGIRLGTSYKDKVRVVFDLAPPSVPPYQIIREKDGLVVVMEQPSGSPAIKSAPKTQSALPLSTTKVVTTSALVKPAPEKPLAAVPPGKTMLHICSFKQKANAEKEVQRLEKHGYKSFLAEEEISGQRWFRVYIGNFKDEQEARKVGSELKRKGLISYFKPTKVDESIRR